MPVHRRVWPRKVPAVAAYVGTLALVGLGAGIIDQVQGIEGSHGMSAASSPFYYLGWLLLILGVAFLFAAIDVIHFHPVWWFALSVPVEIYGWWNTWWSFIDLAECGGCHALLGGQVGLANLGPLGSVLVPTWVFVLTTVVAILAPVIVAVVAPRDIDRCPPDSGVLFARRPEPWEERAWEDREGEIEE